MRLQTIDCTDRDALYEAGIPAKRINLMRWIPTSLIAFFMCPVLAHRLPPIFTPHALDLVFTTS